MDAGADLEKPAARDDGSQTRAHRTPRERRAGITHGFKVAARQVFTVIMRSWYVLNNL